MAIIVVVATLIVRPQRERNGTGETPGDIRVRAGKARKLNGGKPGGFGQTRREPPEMSG